MSEDVEDDILQLQLENMDLDRRVSLIERNVGVVMNELESKRGIKGKEVQKNGRKTT